MQHELRRCSIKTFLKEEISVYKGNLHTESIIIAITITTWYHFSICHLTMRRAYSNHTIHVQVDSYTKDPMAQNTEGARITIRPERLGVESGTYTLVLSFARVGHNAFHYSSGTPLRQRPSPWLLRIGLTADAVILLCDYSASISGCKFHFSFLSFS